LKLLGFQAWVLWQATQLVVPTGTCLAGLAVAPLAPVWQLVQLVAALNLLWSTLAPDQVLVELWQTSHTLWPACIVSLGLLLVWQVAHCVLTLTLPCSLAGVQAT
jgi:uncharacterized membrane protein